MNKISIDIFHEVLTHDKILKTILTTAKRVTFNTLLLTPHKIYFCYLGTTGKRSWSRWRSQIGHRLGLSPFRLRPRLPERGHHWRSSSWENQRRCSEKRRFVHHEQSLEHSSQTRTRRGSYRHYIEEPSTWVLGFISHPLASCLQGMISFKYGIYWWDKVCL